MRRGIFGGTFNPIHYGHLRSAEEARERARLDTVVFIPAGRPPLKDEELLAAEHRYEMTRRAVRSNERFEVSSIELNDRDRSFTYRTLDRAREEWPDDELFFILGVDAFVDMPLWKNPEYVVGIVDFIVVTRPGYPLGRLAESPYLSDASRETVRGWHLLTKVAPDPAWAETPLLKLRSGRTVRVVTSTPIGISSTAIRSLVRKGWSIRYLVPESVESYINEHRLYRE